jgi:hypothetical protein
MKAEIRGKWAAKLESGRYAQAAGALRRGDSFCCLGVLCELFREETGEGEWVGALPGGQYRFVARGCGSAVALPVSVRDWAGLDDTNPVLIPGDPEGWAAYLNDHKMRFPQIAAHVRQLPSTEEREPV